MQILLIGAGAVGQVYGSHLSKAGAEVSVFVRGKYLAQCRNGFPLFQLQRKQSHQFSHFMPTRVISTVEEISQDHYDQIWLCVPTDALEETWLQELGAAIDEQTTLVYLQPGAHVAARLRQFFPNHQLVAGLIGMASFQTPLRGDPRLNEPGVAYYLPRFAPSCFSGPTEPVRKIVQLFHQSGCPARAHKDAAQAAALSSTILMPHMAALELSDWSISHMLGSPLAKLAARSSGEALRAVARHLQIPVPWHAILLRAWLLRLVFLIAQRWAPFALEPYLKYHFSKVLPQTRMLMNAYVEMSQRYALPHVGLRELCDRTLAPRP